MANHPIVHIEFPALDPRTAGDFYHQAFGWDTEYIQEMDYVTFDAEPGPGGGYVKVDNQNFKPGDVTVYIETEDIDATLTKIESLGGKTLVPKSEIPSVGWYAFFADPTGNRVGLFTGLSE